MAHAHAHAHAHEHEHEHEHEHAHAHAFYISVIQRIATIFSLHERSASLKFCT
jgi:hypothetical protein